MSEKLPLKQMAAQHVNEKWYKMNSRALHSLFFAHMTGGKWVKSFVAQTTKLWHQKKKPKVNLLSFETIQILCRDVKKSFMGSDREALCQVSVLSLHGVFINTSITHIQTLSNCHTVDYGHSDTLSIQLTQTQHEATLLWWFHSLWESRDANFTVQHQTISP